MAKNTKVIFEAATFVDAVQRAARVAPHKGAAYDRAAGIEISGEPTSEWIYLRATNLDTSFLQKVKYTDATMRQAFRWRIPSSLLAGLVAAFPLTTGTTIEFIDPDDGAIRIASGNVKAKLHLIEGELPTVTEFPTDDLSEAQDFSQRAAQVTWACDKDNSLLAGVYIDGESLIGCDRQVAAIIPCEVPIEKPIIVPLWNISTILRSATDVRLAARDKELQIMLDTESQATSRLIEGVYPDVKKLLRRDDYTGMVKVPRQTTVDAINRMLVVARSERMPTLKITFIPAIASPEMVLDLEVPQIGRIQDTVEISGEFDSSFEIWFTPSILIQALENAQEDQVTIQFGHPDSSIAHLKHVYITNGKGYEAFVTPRRP